MRTLTTRHRKMFVTFAVCAVVGITGLVFAALLGDITGPSTGKLGHLTAVTVSAGPVPGAALMPGGTAPGSVSITNPNSQTVYIISQGDAAGPFVDSTTTQPFDSPLQSQLSVDGHAISGLPVPPGTSVFELDPVFRLSSDASLAGVGDHAFTKNIRLTLADSPGG